MSLKKPQLRMATTVMLRWLSREVLFVPTPLKSKRTMFRLLVSALFTSVEPLYHQGICLVKLKAATSQLVLLVPNIAVGMVVVFDAASAATSSTVSNKSMTYAKSTLLSPAV